MTKEQTKDLYLEGTCLTAEQEEAIAKAKETLKSYGYLVRNPWSKVDIVTFISYNHKVYPLLSALPKDELEEAIDSIAEAVEDNCEAAIDIDWNAIEYAVEQHEEALREQLTKAS